MMILSVCGHLHSAYGTGIVVLREGRREGGRKKVWAVEKRQRGRKWRESE